MDVRKRPLRGSEHLVHDQYTGFARYSGEVTRDHWGIIGQPRLIDPKHPQEIPLSQREGAPPSMVSQQDEVFVDDAFVTQDDWATVDQ